MINQSPVRCRKTDWFLDSIVRNQIDNCSDLVNLSLEELQKKCNINPWEKKSSLGYKKMKTAEIQAKSILSKSKIYDWTINPYRGCQHGCSYCYAKFMKRFTGHRESWGNFAEVPYYSWTSHLYFSLGVLAKIALSVGGLAIPYFLKINRHLISL